MTEKKIKVSIIVPIYKVEKYLRECVDSILCQTLREIEIILIDDGSPDECGKIVDEYASIDKRVVAVHQKNSGYSKTVNRGIKMARGEFIGIVESDDFIEPDMYETLYRTAKKNRTDVTKAMFFSYNSTVTAGLQNKIYANPTIDLRSAPDTVFSVATWPKIIGMHASLWSSLYKASFVKKIKIPETAGASYQDFPFMAEVMCRAKRIMVVKRPLYHWRNEPAQNNSTSARGEKLLLMADNSRRALEVVKKYGLYEVCKEPLFAHFAWANIVFFIRIQRKYRREYYEKMVELFSEIRDDTSFKYIYFTPYDKKMTSYFMKPHGLLRYSIKSKIHAVKMWFRDLAGVIFPTYRAMTFVKYQNFELSQQLEVLTNEVLAIQRELQKK